MKTMGFPGYFLIVEDFIRVGRRWAWSIGPGRGSGRRLGGGLLPRNHPGRPHTLRPPFRTLPQPRPYLLLDIDVDFDDDGRETVLNYVTERYGAPNVAHIITYGTLAAKSAIRTWRE